jgi:hypothetical protein
VADLSGQKSLGAILGLAHVPNQLGGAAGIHAGGLSFDLTGRCEAALSLAALVSAIGLAALAFLPGRRAGG